jgi:hypothetical protein
MGYFRKHWSIELQGDVVKCTEEVVWSKFPFFDSRANTSFSLKSGGYH